jgi:hypothetical protein
VDHDPEQINLLACCFRCDVSSFSALLSLYQAEGAALLCFIGLFGLEVDLLRTEFLCDCRATIKIR